MEAKGSRQGTSDTTRVSLIQCVAPENTHTPPKDGVLGLNPPPQPLWKFSFASDFPLTILASETPTPLEFPVTLLRVK